MKIKPLLILLFVCGFCFAGTAKADITYNCNSYWEWGNNPGTLQYDPLLSAKQFDLIISRHYGCVASGINGNTYFNSNQFQDLNVQLESISASSGQIFNNINPPGTVSTIGFTNATVNYGSGALSNNVRLKISNKTSMPSPGYHYFPITIEYPTQLNEYYYSYSYSCGFFSTCHSTYHGYYPTGYVQAATDLVILVGSSMSLTMTGGSSQGEINFDQQGGLTTGATRAASIRLRANSPYKVTMTSGNNGYLKLNNLSTSPEQIAYSAKFADTPISPNTAFTNTNPTGTGGADIDVPFEITIGNTENARAGWYKDVVTLTISSAM